MTLFDTEKRPRGLRALSALKAKSHRKKNSDPPSPQDDAVDVPDYLAADAVPPIPSNKQLPQPPPVHIISRREVPGPPPPTAMRNGPMPMDPMPNNSNTTPVNPVPAPRPPPSDIPAPAEPPAKPLRSPAAPMGPGPGPQVQMPTNQVPRGAVPSATVPHSPKPIRPPSIPVVEHIPSDGSPAMLANGEDTAAAATDGFIHEQPDTGNAATPVAYRAPDADNIEEEGNDEPGPLPEERPESVTPLPLLPPDVPAVAAPLADIHFNCYQEHRAMPIANNVWYPVPCMACHKHDREIRHRCVYCCLRVCNACFQVLQRCQRRSLGELLEGIQE